MLPKKGKKGKKKKNPVLEALKKPVKVPNYKIKW